MILSELLKHINFIEVSGSTEKEISAIEFDSRKLVSNTLFVAQRGVTVDGHEFISKVIELGASVIVCEELPAELSEETTYVKVADSNVVLGELAAAYYDFPSTKMKVVGITGTNGKTSIATLLYDMFLKLGYSVGLLSTISYRINETEEAASHTTPNALRIQQLLAEMVYAGCEYCFMEVSSHAVHQKRIAGIEFAGGVFTNITHDHLDYHKTFAAYIKAKKGFFDGLSKSAFAITNTDDKNGLVMLQNTKAQKVTYSTRSMADFRCKVLENHFDGMLLNMDDQEIWTRFVGNFNAANLLAVYSTALQLGQNKEEVLPVISNLNPVQGRFETLKSMDGKFAIVDYAHTPDELKIVLGEFA
jgi:UDP-N-acetylmuramoyl-L-alanyl-D-glutamate--2,6-diaminopimelate ligase